LVQRRTATAQMTAARMTYTNDKDWKTESMPDADNEAPPFLPIESIASPASNTVWITSSKQSNKVTIRPPFPC